MSDPNKSPRTGLASSELMGMLIFTLSAFPLVLVSMALTTGVDAGGGGTKAIAQAVVQGFGYVPALVCAGGFAVVGIAMVLSGHAVDAGRHLAGFLFTAVGLGVCLGALRESGQGILHGGAFGDATGGALGAIGIWLGLVVGGAVSFTAVWLAWLGGVEGTGARFRRNSGQIPTISDALSERDSDGVSSAEANALVPDADTINYMEELWQGTDPVQQAPPIPPSPYPEDVRLLGQIPEGAAVLSDQDDQFETYREADPGASAWRPAAANRPSADAPGEDLAGSDGVATGSAVIEPLEAAQPLVTTTPVAAGGGPPRPAWEQAPLFTEKGAVEEEEEAELEESEEAEAELEESEEAEAELEEGEEAEAELEEEEEAEEEPEEEEEAEAELEEGEEAEEELEEEEEAEAELEEGEEAEEEPEEEEEAEAELEEEEDAEEEPEEEEEAEAELEEGEEAEAELEEEEDAEAELEEEEEAEEEPEEEVVLQPASPAGAGDPISGPEFSPEELIHEAGRLFLTHGRVAVSLLQRRFGLDFDDACELLDELQELGLIGPYMGGQKRDILMSPDDWEGRLAGS